MARDLLVLDEPWSGLDVAAASTLRTFLTSSQAAVLVTDHHGHDLPGARVLPLSSSSAGVVIELARVGSLLSQVSALEGVLSADAVGSGARVEVAAAHSDEVLASVLRLGCSVRSVRS